MTQLEKAIESGSQLRPRTKELYLQHVRAFLAFLGEKSIRDADRDDVANWCRAMRRARISPQSVNVALNALRYAAEHGHVKRLAGYAKECRLPVDGARQKKTDRALAWSEGVGLVKVCDGTAPRDIRDRAIITLGLRTGMLRFSMCQLNIQDVKFPNLTFVKKGGEPHTIQLDAVTGAAIVAWVAWLATYKITKGRLFRSLGRERIDIHVSRTGNEKAVSIGDQLTPDGLYRVIRDRARKAELDDLYPHVFRKTFLAWTKRAGATPSQIAAVTGHKSDAVGDDSGVTAPPANMLLPPWNRKLK